MKRTNIRPVRFATTALKENDTPVQNGLAVTPSQMLEMTNQGIPITPSNLGLTYQEGVGKLDFEPPMEYRRGVDITDMWEHREDFKGKMSSKEFKNLLKSQEHE